MEETRILWIYRRKSGGFGSYASDFAFNVESFEFCFWLNFIITKRKFNWYDVDEAEMIEQNVEYDSCVNTRWSVA